MIVITAIKNFFIFSQLPVTIYSVFQILQRKFALEVLITKKLERIRKYPKVSQRSRQESNLSGKVKYNNSLQSPITLGETFDRYKFSEIGLNTMWRSLDEIFPLAGETKHCTVIPEHILGIQ